MNIKEMDPNKLWKLIEKLEADNRFLNEMAVKLLEINEGLAKLQPPPPIYIMASQKTIDEIIARRKRDDDNGALQS